jgi:hypothetical protein
VDFIRRRPFRRQRGGAVVVTLDPAEAAVLEQLVGELSGLFSGGGASEDHDPAEAKVMGRLFPRAYLDPTEEAAESEWQRLVHDDLLMGRRAALATVGGVLEGAVSHRGRLEMSISTEEAEALLAVLNDARLALGTKLDVTEEMDLSGLDPNDPDAGPYAIYWWLGMLEEHLVEVLAG